jgi:hypothetical protein
MNSSHSPPTALRMEKKKRRGKGREEEKRRDEMKILIRY